VSDSSPAAVYWHLDGWGRIVPDTQPHREILLEDLMKPLGLSMALRLTRYFGNTPQFWLGLQAAHDLEVATRRSVGQIERDVHPREAA
jgi:hypothetical protein